MKRISVFWALCLCLIVILCVVCACDEDPITPDPVDSVVTIVTNSKSVTIDDTDVANYDFTTLFTIVKDNQIETVEKSYLDLSAVSAYKDSFIVTCNYLNGSASVVVNVNKTVTLTLEQEEITLNSAVVQDYDFLSLFTLQVKGKVVEITAEMITSTVKDVDGDYIFQVNYVSQTATLTVHVSSAHQVDAVPSYKTVELTLAELENFDYTMLFSLYVDGTAVEVTSEMIDWSSLQNAEVGKNYTVYFTYDNEKDHGEATVTVSVVAESEFKVTSKNIVTYPNGEYIDLSSLFEISKGEQKIPVTNDMVSGEIDYSVDGDNEITLHFNNTTYTATVTVRRGVVISYATSDTITVQSGTDKNSYLFADDFVVIVNGLRFYNIDRFIDASEVDFSTAGTYTATLNLPYNDSPVGLTSVKFKYFTETITYKVVDVNYSVSVKEDSVVLPFGTTDFDVFSNIHLIRNGVYNAIVDSPDYVGRFYCYAECASEIDFNSYESQQVVVNLYVYGFDSAELGEPIQVSYFVKLENSVQINATNRTTFGGETINPISLFEVVHNGEKIKVTSDMITGKVDTFHAGTYTVTLNYLGATAQASVIVVNPQLIGTYKTGLTTISTSSDDDDEDYSESYWEEEVGSSTETPVTTTPTSTLGDLVINCDGTMSFNGIYAIITDAIDENTLIVKAGSYEYTLYYDNGIVVLNPDNSVRLGFSESKRPFVYFHTDIWTFKSAITINYGSEYVLAGTMVTYSIDIARITAVDGEESLWYGLKTHLINKTSSDTVYEVTWGEVEFADGFVMAANIVSSLTFNGKTVDFTMQSRNVGKVNRNSDSSAEWNGKVFSGTVDGAPATLTVSSSSNMSFSINGTKVISASSYELSNAMKNGGCNFSDNTVLLYNLDEENGKICSYKFLVDPENNTFQLLEKDGIWGKYVTSDGSMWVFLDGYGMGTVNFQSTSYYTTLFTYTLANQEVRIDFINTNSLFTHGSHITFHLADLKNILTVKYSHNNEYAGVVLKNTHITDGAIVSFSTNEFKVGTGCLDAIYNSLSIVTADGELTLEQKQNSTVDGTPRGKKIVDVSAIHTGKGGVYQLCVNIMVDGVVNTSSFAVQVLDEIYADSVYVGNYGSAIANSNCSLVLTSYGTASLVVGGKLYSGYFVTTANDSSFTAHLYNGKNEIVLHGESVVEGLIFVNGSGTMSFTDYFALGEVTTAGTEGAFLRKITVSGGTVYMFSVSITTAGEFVTVTPTDEESIFLVTRQSGADFVAKVKFGNTTSGLSIADRLRGTYTCDNAEEIVIDGFGGVKVGLSSGTYYYSGNIVAVTIGSNISLYSLNTTEKTYQPKQLNIASVLVGGIYQASYICNAGTEDSYTVTTSFVFGENGVVTAYSVSNDYPGNYLPSFASQMGQSGIYWVNNNKIYLEICGQTFAFVANNVIECSIITCESTSLVGSDAGYFSAGITFTLEC